MEDLHSHAQIHNALLQSETVVVYGSGLEAIQLASTFRTYLDEQGISDTKIILFDDAVSDFRGTIGNNIWKHIIKRKLKEMRISVLDDVTIKSFNGTHELNKIIFTTGADDDKKKQFIKPSMMVVEKGLGNGMIEYRDILHMQDIKQYPEFDEIKRIFKPDGRFGITHGDEDLHSTLLAAGSCCEFKSFITKGNYRTLDIKYNIESGFYAAMSMLDKQIQFHHLPMHRLTLGDKELYYIGEMNAEYDEVITCNQNL